MGSSQKIKGKYAGLLISEKVKTFNPTLRRSYALKSFPKDLKQRIYTYVCIQYSRLYFMSIFGRFFRRLRFILTPSMFQKVSPNGLAESVEEMLAQIIQARRIDLMEEMPLIIAKCLLAIFLTVLKSKKFMMHSHVSQLFCRTT